MRRGSREQAECWKHKILRLLGNHCFPIHCLIVKILFSMWSIWVQGRGWQKEQESPHCHAFRAEASSGFSCEERYYWHGHICFCPTLRKLLVLCSGERKVKMERKPHKACSLLKSLRPQTPQASDLSLLEIWTLHFQLHWLRCPSTSDKEISISMILAQNIEQHPWTPVKKERRKPQNPHIHLFSVENLNASLQSFWQRAENFLGFQRSVGLSSLMVF